MNPQKIFAQLYDKLGNFQNNGGPELLNELIKDTELKEAASLIAELFIQKFDNGKPDDLEWLLKEILEVKPELAYVDFPYNPIFAATIIHGVFDVYRGYVEKGIEVYLKDKSGEEKFDCYSDLSITAQQISEDLFPKYEQYFKGMHYNTAFRRDAENPHILMITEEDVLFYERIVRNYNSIIGRRIIIDDLNKRSDVDFDE
jgi:hypothetical protein